MLLLPIALFAQPTINGYTPPRNTTATAANADVVITWSEAMNTATLTSGNIRVWGAQTGLYSTSAVFSYSGGNTIVTVNPASNFRPGELVSVSVTTGVQSGTGATIARGMVWSFTAGVQGGWGLFANTWSEGVYDVYSYKSALADLDGDGDLDVFQANFGVNKVLLNDGSGTYSTGWVQSSNGTASVGIALFDVDGDGDIDVYEGNNNADNKVWKNDGSGNFSNTWTQSGGATRTQRIAYGDVDGDGDIDVFESNYTNQANKVWLNDGDGNFSIGWTQPSGATNTLSVAMGDFDGDGDLDVFEGNEYQSNKVWSNDGNGNFTNTWTQSGGATASYSLSVGDVDGDGDLDVFEGNIGDNNKVWKNDGSGNFSNTWTQSSGAANTFDVAMGDMDGDGDLDVFEGNYNNQPSKVWLNDGSGVYSEGWGYGSGTANTNGVSLGDVDGDGDIDMVEGRNGQGCSVWLNVPFSLTGFSPTTNALHVVSTATVSLTFSTGVKESTATGANIRIMGSQTGLYNTSSIVYNSGTNMVNLSPSSSFKPGELVSVSVTTGVQAVSGVPLSNARMWSFTAGAQGGWGVFANTWSEGAYDAYSYSAALADLDGDGDLDIFQANFGVNKVLLNDGSGTYSVGWAQSSSGTTSVGTVLFDVDGDGDIDVYEGNNNADNKVWKNDGSGNFTNTWTQSGGATRTSSVAYGDVDGDGDIDVFEGNYSNQSNRVWLNDGNGNFTVGWTQGGGATNTLSIVMGDMDGDGDLDVFEGNEYQSSKVWKNDGNGNFSNTWTQSGGITAAQCLSIGDVDGDGDLDVFEGNIGDNNKVWKNDGNGNFTNTWTQSSDAKNTFGMAMGDVDGDGDLDMFEGIYNGMNKVWLNDGNGSFTVGWEQGSGSTSTYGVSLGDADGDGDIDMVEGNSGGGSKVWMNSRLRVVVENQSTSATASGGEVILTLQLQSKDGTLFTVPQGSKTISIAVDSPLLEFATAVTQATVLAGQQWTTVAVSLYNTTLSPITTSLTIRLLENGSIPTTATLTIGANNAPQISTSATAIEIREDSSTRLTVSVWDIETATSSLVITATSSNVALLPNSAIVQIGSTDATTSLEIQPVTNGNGVVEVSVSVSDGLSVVTTSFTITIRSVNDAPSFGTTGNISVLDEDSGQSIANHLVSINAGAADEVGQNAQFFVGNDNNALFAVQPAISSTGTLTFTPAHWAQGMATVSVYAQDDGGTADGGVNTSATQSFAISVGLSPATHLRMVGMNPVLAQSGEIVELIVTSYTALGTQRATTATTAVGVQWDTPYISLFAGSTQATMSAGSSEASIHVAFFSSSTANITTLTTVESASGALLATSVSIMVLDAVPSALAVTTNNQQASISWTAPAAQGVTGYAVYRGTVSGNLAEIGTSATTSYVDNTAANGAMYYYAVQAVAGGFRGGLSDEEIVTIPQLTLLTPNGGEEWRIGVKRTVSWLTAGTVATVAVEYSTDNGSSWLPIVASTSNTGSVVWHIATTATSAAAMVRVYDVSRPDVRDESDVLFSILDPIAPVATLSALALDDAVQLSWSASRTAGVTGYAVYQGITSGSLSLLTTVGADATTYTHTGVNDGLRHYYALKTLIGGDESLLSVEASIVPNTIRILYANGGEVLQVGTQQNLQWQYSGDISSMRVEYSTDNGGSWTPIAQIVSLSGNKPLTSYNQNWEVANTPTTTALIRVVSLSPTSISDQSDAVFTIQAIAPPTNLMATAGSTTISLSWTASTSASIAQYRILRGTTTSSMSIIDSVGAATTTYTDAGVNVCTQYYYAVQTRVGSYASANSNVAGARIALPESITVLSPNGGESWQVGVTRSITWTSTACTVPSMVTLEYSSNNGGSWSTIATVANTGSYAWSIPNAASAQALVRVSGNALSDQSDAVFTIAPIPAPSGLAATAGDGSVGLSWTASSAEGLSGYGIWRGTTSGSLSLLTTVGAATTSYTDNSAMNCTLYVYGVTAMVGSYHSASSNEAEAVPQITPALALTSPNGGESWQVGVTRSITWTSTACTVPSMVTLEYSGNNGGSWSTIATVANTGSYVWSIPDAASAQALVRVNDGTLSDQSDAVFTIAPIPTASGLAATAGDGSVGLSWTASSAEGLSGYGIWRGTTSGSLSLLSTVGAATTSYTDNSVTNCTLYVYGVTAMVSSYHSASSNEAEAAPQITPALVVTSPNGGEQWRMYLPHIITWTSTGCSVPSTVNIELSLNNGGSWTSVANAAANTGSYTWTPMGMSPSAQALIRISGGALQDQSDAVFELLPRPYPSAAASPVATSASYCTDGSIPSLGTVLSLSDDYFSATTLVVEVASSNPALLPVSGIAQTSSTGATTSFAFVPVQNVAGTANVTFTVRNAVESTVTTTVSVSVVVHALPSAVITGSTSACANTGGYTYSVPTEAGGTYAWTVVGGSVTSGAGTREIAVEWGTAGAGSVSVVVMNTNGCSATSLKGVDIHANPVPSIAVGGATTFCSGGSVMLTAQPAGMSYLWSNGATAQSIEVTQSGSYSVMVTNQYGCSVVSTSVSVTVHPAVTASASASGSTTLCSGSSVQLVGGGSSPVGGLTFMWSPTAGLSNANISNPIATPSATTTYTLLVMDGNGCSSTASVTITVIPAPVTTVSGDATICEGGSTQLLATGGTNYSWSPTVGLSDANIANPVASPSVTTTYSVTISSAGNCPVQRSVTVTVAAPVVAGVSSDVAICKGGSTQLVATGGTSYSWSPTTGLSNANIANPVASPSATTMYTVTVSGAGGCTSTASVTVTVNPVTLQATVLLEGAYAGGGMQTNLQMQNLLPTNQPYNTAPYNYAGTEVMNVTSGTAVVDWVLVDVRSGTGSGSLVERRAGLLRSDGVIVGSDGGTMVYPSLSASQSYYVVVWHRNHIGVMSALPVNVNGSCGYVYNFTGSPTAAYIQFADGQKQLATGVYGMAAGDATSDGIVNATDRVAVRNASGALGYEQSDVSLDGIVNAVDRVIVRNNAFWVTQVP